MSKLPVIIVATLVVVIVAIGGYYLSDYEQQADSGDELINITLAVSVTPLSAPFYIANEKGFFEDEGLDVTIVDYKGGHRCLSALLEGDVDMATASDLPVMFNSFKRDDYVVVATFVKSNNDVKIITRKDSGITLAKDLEGKKVGITLGASNQFFLEIFSVINRLNTFELEIIDIQPEDMPYALQSGQVDAISVWEPFGYETIKLLDDNVFIFPKTDDYVETFNLVVMKDYIRSDSEAIEKVLRAIDKSISFIDYNEDEAQDIIVNRLKTDRGFIEWIWADFIYELSLDQSLIITLEDESRWAIKNNLTDRTIVPNYLNFIYIDGLDIVKSEAVKIIR